MITNVGDVELTPASSHAATHWASEASSAVTAAASVASFESTTASASAWVDEAWLGLTVLEGRISIRCRYQVCHAHLANVD